MLPTPPYLPLIAILPIVLILILILGLHWSTDRAGPTSWLLTNAIAIFFFGADATLAALASLKGFLLGLQIAYIVFAGVLLYHIVDSAGGISIIARALETATSDKLLQLLIVSWAFSSFVQGVSGFGIPVAVTAPILAAMGFRPIVAVSSTLIGHAWATTFGTLATSFLILVLVAHSDPHHLAFWSSILLGVACIATGLMICHSYGGQKASRSGLPYVLMIGTVMATVQFVIAFFIRAYTIASFTAGGLGCLAGIVISKRSSRLDVSHHDKRERNLEFHRAFAPYYLLVCLTVASSIPTLTQIFSNRLLFSMSFPGTMTSYNWVNPPVDSFAKFDLLLHPGSLILASACFGFLTYARTGHMSRVELGTSLKKTASESIRAGLAVISLTMTALVMDESGMTFLLAKTTSESLGHLYPGASVFVGVLGTFLTGSNTASNALFGAFQKSTAGFLNVDEYLMLAALTAGGALGGMMTPSKVIVGVSTSKELSGREGEIIKKIAPYCLSLSGLIGLIVALILLL